MKTRLSLSLCLCALVWIAPVRALSLYGVDLGRAKQMQLRRAVQRAGAVLVHEGGEKLFDRYGSEKLLKGSHTLYLGFNRNSGDFAFLEYTLWPRYTTWMRSKLAHEYGEPQRQPGHFLSDDAFQWQVDGVDIRLFRDFDCGCTRLIYSHPAQLDTLLDLQAERGKSARNRRLTEQSHAF